MVHHVVFSAHAKIASDLMYWLPSAVDDPSLRLTIGWIQPVAHVWSHP